MKNCQKISNKLLLAHTYDSTHIHWFLINVSYLQYDWRDIPAAEINPIIFVTELAFLEKITDSPKNRMFLQIITLIVLTALLSAGAAAELDGGGGIGGKPGPGGGGRFGGKPTGGGIPLGGIPPGGGGGPLGKPGGGGIPGGGNGGGTLAGSIILQHQFHMKEYKNI